MPDVTLRGGSPLCQVQTCKARWAVLLPDHKLGPRLVQAVFGDDHPGECFLVCWKHYRRLHNSAGIALGYRMHNGKISAYVREEYF